MNTRIKDLKATVKRLEALAGVGQKYCARCQLYKRHRWPDPHWLKPHPGVIVMKKCDFCGSEYAISLAEIPEEERDAFRLYFSFTYEDLYTNPKAAALDRWVRLRPKHKKRRAKPAMGKAKNDKGKRALFHLWEEDDKLIARRGRLLRAKYGRGPFPEQHRLIESVRNRERNRKPHDLFVSGLIDLEQEETDHLICAELEKIIWGEIRPQTTAAIEKIGRDIERLIETAKEKTQNAIQDSRNVSQKLQAAPEEKESSTNIGAEGEPELSENDKIIRDAINSGRLQIAGGFKPGSYD